MVAFYVPQEKGAFNPCSTGAHFHFPSSSTLTLLLWDKVSGTYNGCIGKPVLRERSRKCLFSDCPNDPVLDIF